MLKYLNAEDIEIIIAECDAMNTRPSGRVIDVKGIPFEEAPSSNKLAGIIGKLSQEAILELKALMWMGQNHGPFEEMLTQAKKTKDGNEAQYIATMSASLPQYLWAGLEMLKPG
jgi:hypothetical protein